MKARRDCLKSAVVGGLEQWEKECRESPTRHNPMPPKSLKRPPGPSPLDKHIWANEAIPGIDPMDNAYEAGLEFTKGKNFPNPRYLGERMFSAGCITGLLERIGAMDERLKKLENKGPTK